MCLTADFSLATMSPAMKKVFLVLVSICFFLSLMTESVHAATDVGQTVQGVITSVVDKKSEGDSHTFVGRIVDALTDLLIPKVKEVIVEEIRVCTQKFGDTIGERIMENERVKKIVGIVQFTCWTIIIYLVLVTFFLFFALRRLYAQNLLVLKLLGEMKQGEAASRLTN